MAILGADAAARVAQHAELDAAREAGLANLQRRGQQVAQALVGAVENRRGGFPIQLGASQHLLHDSIQIQVFKFDHRCTCSSLRQVVIIAGAQAPIRAPAGRCRYAI